MIKIISVLLIIYFSISTFSIYSIFRGYPIFIDLVVYSLAFTFSCIFFFFAFYQDFRNAYFGIRTSFGERKTRRKKLDNQFENHGGKIGYHESNTDHIAIMWVSESHNNYPVLKKDGILNLMEHYKRNKIEFSLDFIYLSDDFLSLVKSQRTTGIHIFGHGRIDSLYFEDGVVQFRELKDVSPKEFVAHWHCNHGEGKSLGEYIGKKYFAPYGKRMPFTNRRDIKKLINDELEWKINEKFSREN